jgi:hypothetical protein
MYVQSMYMKCITNLILALAQRTNTMGFNRLHQLLTRCIIITYQHMIPDVSEQIELVRIQNMSKL